MMFVRGDHSIRSGEIIIEIDEEWLDIRQHLVATDPYDQLNPDKMRMVTTSEIAGNRHQHFPPVDMRSRDGGPPINYIRTRRVLLRDGRDARFMMDPALRTIEEIPGERIHFDMDRKVGRITDAIFDPENKDTYETLKEIGRKIHGVSRPFVSGIYKEVNLQNPYAFWHWAYHMRKIMDGNEEHNGGPERHRGCATTGPRLCRPIQNVDQMPTMLEIAKSGYVKIPLGPMSKEAADEFDAEHKQNDPDYFKPIDRRRGEVILSPWLAGVSTTNGRDNEW